jgi:cyanophycin synthetase
MLYPASAPKRIPVIAITGTNGKTTVTRMIAHALCAMGTVGMTTTDGISIGGEIVAEGDLTGPWSARVVLADPIVDVAVLETARGGIMNGGLGFDWADVGVVTNIQPDHFGQDGVETLDDIVRVKRLIAERVAEGGTLVLNADDERVAALAAHPKVTAVPKRIMYFSLSPANPVIQAHLQSGGAAFVLNDGWIEARDGAKVTPLARVASMPSTLSGTATFQIANLLAAAAAATAAGMAPERVMAALTEFDHAVHNAGRVNVFAYRGGHLVLDYAHNPAAVRTMCETALRWDGRVTAVLGLPGDRSDALICDGARAAAGVDRVILREDDDPRGRPRGAMAGMMREALAAAQPSLKIDIVLNELEAIDAAMASLSGGDVALLFVDDIAAVRDRLLERGAEPVAAFTPPLRRAAAQSAA